MPVGRLARRADPEQLEELLLEQPVVVAQVEAEEREGLDEGAAADHHLRASAGEEVEGRELLVQADRNGRAQHGHGAREANALRARCHGGENDSGGRDGEVRPVVLADAEDVESDLVCELGLLDDLAQPLLRALALADVREREHADLHERVLARSR